MFRVNVHISLVSRHLGVLWFETANNKIIAPSCTRITKKRLLECVRFASPYIHRMKYEIHFISLAYLMARSRCDFNYRRWWLWWWWNNQVLNRAHVILDFDKRLLRILKTTLGACNRLYIETRFHFDWNICNNGGKIKHKTQIKLPKNFESKTVKNHFNKQPLQLHKFRILINKHKNAYRVFYR